MASNEGSDVEAASVQERLKGILPGEKYRNLFQIGRGAFRYAFEADWGPGEKVLEKRVVLVDRVNPGQSKMAQQALARGSSTKREIVALGALPEAEEHNILPLLDFFEPEEKDYAVSVVPKVKGTTLAEAGKLSEGDFGKVFSGYLRGMKYYVGQGLLHRDLNANNLYVQRNGHGLEGLVGDMGTSCASDELAEKVTPTAGNRDFVMDPKLISSLRGSVRRYALDSELYSFGKNALRALTGEQVVGCDPETGKAFLVEEGKPGKEITFPDGTLDIKAHDLAIQDALKGSRYSKVLGRCLTADETNRYKSVEDLARDFDKAGKPNLWERTKKNWKKMALFGTLGLAALGGIGYEVQQYNQNIEAKLLESEKHKVEVAWDAEGGKLVNNTFDLKFNASTHKSNVKDGVGLLRLDSGKNIDYFIHVGEIPRNKKKDVGQTSLTGSIYLEGVSTNSIPIREFGTWSESVVYSSGEGGSGFNGSLKIPEGFKKGVYTLAVEIYTPTIKDNSNSTHLENVIYPKKNGIINRLRIPVVVGKPDDEAYLDRVSLEGLGYGNYYSMTDLSKYSPGRFNILSNDKEISVEVSVPEDNFKSSKPSNFSNSFSLPDGTNVVERIMCLKVVKGNNVLYSTAYPIRRREIIPGYTEWNFSSGERGFAEKLIDYRQKLEASVQKSEITKR